MRGASWKSSAGGSGLWIKLGRSRLHHHIGMMAQLVTLLAGKQLKQFARRFRVAIPAVAMRHCCSECRLRIQSAEASNDSCRFLLCNDLVARGILSNFKLTCYRKLYGGCPIPKKV